MQKSKFKEAFQAFIDRDFGYPGWCFIFHLETSKMLVYSAEKRQYTLSEVVFANADFREDLCLRMGYIEISREY